jgi:Tfp pilus assembly protein PilX
LRCATDRSGFALALALLATILIAAVLAALFFAVNQDTRTGSAIARRDHSLAAAESALEGGLEQLRSNPPADSPPGSAESRTILADGEPAVVHITRLDSGLFWLVAVVGNDGDPVAPARRIGAVVTQFRGSSDSISIVRVVERGWSELF